LFHADGRIDRWTERHGEANFANAPKMEKKKLEKHPEIIPEYLCISVILGTQWLLYGTTCLGIQTLCSIHAVYLRVSHDYHSKRRLLP
jgi:hypothetical protein